MARVSGEPQQMGAGLWQYHAEQKWAGYSLWYEEFYQTSTFTTIASGGGQMDETTTIDLEALGDVATELLLKPLASQDRWRDDYLAAAGEAALARQEAMAAIESVVQPQRVVFQPRV